MEDEGAGVVVVVAVVVTVEEMPVGEGLVVVGTDGKASAVRTCFL